MRQLQKSRRGEESICSLSRFSYQRAHVVSTPAYLTSKLCLLSLRCLLSGMSRGQTAQRTLGPQRRLRSRHWTGCLLSSAFMLVDASFLDLGELFPPAQACPAGWSGRLRSLHLKCAGLSLGSGWRPSNRLRSRSAFNIQQISKHPHTSRLPLAWLSQLGQLFGRSARCPLSLGQ